MKNYLLLTAAMGAQLAAIAQDRPNIVWITSEDNTIDFVGCYGDPLARTPNIDALAKKRVRYTNAFCSSAASSPARNALITRLYPTAMGTQHMRSYYPIPEEIKLFPKYLQDAGYYCVNSGKMDYNIEDQGELPGWDEVDLKANIWIDNRPKERPFFFVQNFGETHESAVFENKDPLITDPSDVIVPPYLPDTKGVREDRARYYDRNTAMDIRVGEVLQRLEDEGLMDDTIIFYYGDNGGVLGRSKRFLYEAGLHIPLVIYFPEKYKHLAPVAAGGTVDDMVSFVDFAPTMLNMLGLNIPDYMQGQPFLGDNLPKPREYIYAIKGRNDERYDDIYAVRDDKYKYIRNHYPYIAQGQHHNFMWRAQGMLDWVSEYNAGRCNEAQSAFFEPKAVEELYDLESDPHEINNLAGDKEYSKVLERMRNEHKRWSFETRDAGLFSEIEIQDRAKEVGVTPYELLRMKSLPYKEIYETCEMATMAKQSDFKELKKRLSSDDSAIRNWAAIGCIMQPEMAKSAISELQEMATSDKSVTAQITATEALFKAGEKEKAMDILYDIICSNKDVYTRVYAFNVVDRMGDSAPSLRRKILDLYSSYNGTDKRSDVQIILYWKTL